MTTGPSHAAALEPRRASVLFLDLLGYDELVAAAGPERAYLLVTGCLALLDAIARRRGGVVDRYLGDALMAVFGLAGGGAVEEAATAAALEMRDAVARYARESESPAPLAVQIGLNTGPVLASDVRGAIVREFAVMGDAVNVAARLKDKAPPGGILLGEDTRAALPDDLAGESLAPLTLKGKERRVVAFALAADARLLRRRPLDAELLVRLPLVGREAELAALGTAAGRLRAGTGGVVWLTGAAGSGKTRLVAELAAREKGLRFADARATPSDAPGQLARAVAESLAGADGELHRLVAAAAREAPLALVLEDLQWADAASAASLAGLAALTRELPLLLLLTARTEAALPAPLAGLDGERVTLPALPPADARALAAAALGAAANDETLALVTARGGGSPSRLVMAALLAPALETEARRAREAPERSAEAERRRATVLFADITGFTALTERVALPEAHAIVSGCLRLLDEVARRHGGSVDKYLGDCVMAVFGVPLAIEDAPRAAVNAAIEMRRRVAEYNATRGLASPLDVHVGIETGPAIAGEIGGAVLREWALMGESVNAASRLKDLAPRGEIWVGAETARAVRGAFELEALPAELRAGRSALAPQRVLSRDTRLHRARLGAGETLFARFVGRETELAQLRERLAAAARGEGGVVALVADPGVGKSRLLAELAASEEGRGCRWLEGRSLAIGRNLSYHPFADLLRRWAELRDDDPDAYARLAAAIESALPGESAELAPFLGAVVGVALPAEVAEKLAAVPGDALDNLVTRALRRLVAALAKQRPLVLVLEDLYWADLSSIELIESLLGLVRESALLFVFAARPNHPETSDRAIASAERALGERALRLDLAPLGPRDARELLASLFARDDLPRALRDRIEANTAGNPFFLEEVLRALLEQGVLEAVGPRLRATAATERASVPGTVQEVILSRVDRLDPRRKLLLQIASVIGRRFDRAILEAIAARALRDGGTPLGDAVERLVEAALLTPGSTGDPRLGFRHPMIQEVTYDSILEGRRVELHHAVAEQLEAGDPTAPGLHATLAYHFSLGRDLARAEPHLLRAGEEAARSAASNEALHFFREASSLYARMHPEGGDPAVRASLARNLALALFHRGFLLDASDRFNEALELLGEHVPRRRAAMAGRFALGLGGLLGELYAPRLQRRRPPADERDCEIISIMFARAMAQTTGDPTRFLFDTMENVRRLRKVDPASVARAGGMYASMIGIFSFGGLSFDVSRRLLARAEALARDDDPGERLLVRMMRFVHCFLVGEWRRELEIPPDEIAAAIRRGQLWDVTNELFLETATRIGQGRFDEAGAHRERLVELRDQYSYEYAISNVHAADTFLALERRELEPALAAADTYVRSHDEPQINVLALGARAQAELLLGRRDAARESLATAREIAARAGTLPPFNLGAAARSRLQLAVLELEAAQARRSEPPRALRKETSRARRAALRCAAKVAWVRPETLALAGRSAILLGRRRAGVALLERALAEADRLGARPEGARIAVGAAPLLGPDAPLAGRPLREHLGDSRRCFEALDLRWDLERLDAVQSGRAQ